MNRAPAAHPETTGGRALENIDSKKTGPVARQLSRAPAAHPETTGSRAPENIDSKNTGRVARKQAGQSLVETALILAAFMGLLLGMTGVGQLIFVRQTLADRASQAARWGAVNNYDPTAIRNMVQFGTATPEQSQTPFFGLAAAAIEVSNPGCPGVQCRVSVAIPEQGIRSVEPMEDGLVAGTTRGAASAIATGAVSKP